MGTLLVVLLALVVLIVWGALGVYMARGDRSVVRSSLDARRDVIVLPDGREITRQQLREITVRLTVDAQRFTEAMQKVADAFRAAAPTMRQFNERFNAMIEAMSPEDRAEWDRLNA